MLDELQRLLSAFGVSTIQKMIDFFENRITAWASCGRFDECHGLSSEIEIVLYANLRFLSRIIFLQVTKD